MIKAMPEQWIVRVEGKDYGPADLETLREWKREGRVLATNPVRREDVDSAAVGGSAEDALWTTAAEIPGLFETATIPPGEERLAQPPPQLQQQQALRSFGGILGETVGIYRAGFLQFLALALLTVLPSICGQLTAAFIKTAPNVDVDLRSLVAALFSLSMFALTIALWPIYVAAIQILSAELAAGRSLGFFATLNQAVRFWPRVAGLCLFVYGVFFLLTVFGLVIMAIAATGGPSLLTVGLALGLLVLQVWMFGRFFVNVLFWQQFAVLQNAGMVDSLRASKQLARSGQDLPWYQRPLWRGTFIASLWFAFVLLIAFAQEYPTLRHYLSDMMTVQDPQVLLQKLAAAQQTHGFDLQALALSVMQRIFQPLLGIAFVVLYLASRE
jgi:hypothetical protein